MGCVRLEGAIDLHCHYGPDDIQPARPRQYAVTALDAASEAAASGHAAIVLKAHDFATPHLAYTLDQVVDGIRVFGGIVLDQPAGGLNAHAVEHALRLGAKIVWLPTVASYQDVTNGRNPRNHPGPGYRVVDDEGELLPEVREIAALVGEHEAVLATGHVTAEEHFVVAAQLAREIKVLVTHAGERLGGPHLDAQQCRDLADLGATIELTAQTCVEVRGLPGKSPQEMIDIIRLVGIDRCALSSDYGWWDALPHPVAGLRDFADTLWSVGATEAELRTMMCDTPARLLGLDA